MSPINQGNLVTNTDDQIKAVGTAGCGSAKSQDDWSPSDCARIAVDTRPTRGPAASRCMGKMLLGFRLVSDCCSTRADCAAYSHYSRPSRR